VNTLRDRGKNVSEVAADHSLPERQTRALDNCEALIRLYRRHADTARHWYHFLQITGITLGGLTPVALLINGAPAWIPAAMAALGAIAGGLNATFHWHEEWLRNTYFAQALASEQERYLARATEPYRTTLESQTALDNFVARIEDIRMREASQWSDYERTAIEPQGEPVKRTDDRPTPRQVGGDAGRLG